MSYDQIRYDVEDPVATITLHRPEVLNAWTDIMGAELEDALGRAQRDERVVGVVLTGAGRGFCSGVDLAQLNALGAGDAPQLTPVADAVGEPAWGSDLRGTFTYLLSVPKPIIAAVNGASIGVAVPLLLACDIRFMAEDAKLSLAFSQRGLVAEWGTSWLLPRLVGPAVALDLLYTSRTIDGREAARLGVVNRCLPGRELLAAARDYVIGLAERCSPTSLAVMKRQVYQQLHAGLGAAEQEAMALMQASFSGQDLGEGLRAYSEKRPPRYGRLGGPP